MKTYPRLHKTLARHFGARKAKKLITNLHNQDVKLRDISKLTSAVVFNDTKEGHTYWAEIQRQIDPNW